MAEYHSQQIGIGILDSQRKLPWDFSAALSHAVPGPPGRASPRPYLMLMQRHAEEDFRKSVLERAFLTLAVEKSGTCVAYPFDVLRCLDAHTERSGFGKLTVSDRLVFNQLNPNRWEDVMASVGSFEAKTHLTRLLERVAKGERIMITNRGRPVAMLVPPEAGIQRDTAQVGREMLEYRDKIKRCLGAKSFRKLAHEGHRF